MRRQVRFIATLVVLTINAPTVVLEAQAPPRSTARHQTREDHQTSYKGIVVDVIGPRLFSLRAPDSGDEVLVLAPRAISTSKGATVAVTGTLRRIDQRNQRNVSGWAQLSEQIRRRITGRQVVIATAVLSTEEVPETEPEAPAGSPVEPPPPAQPASAPGAISSSPLPLPASTLVAFIQTFAGQAVRIQNARVVGLITPGVFLIEPATRYLKDMGQRDRMAVFVSGGQLRVDPELLVGAIVELEGTARTVLSVQAARDVEWPAKLTQQTLERLEVRAAIVATSVHTAEGTELTARR